MLYRGGRIRSAFFLGAFAVMGLALALREHQLPLFSWIGVAIRLPIPVVKALMISLLVHTRP